MITDEDEQCVSKEIIFHNWESMINDLKKMNGIDIVDEICTALKYDLVKPILEYTRFNLHTGLIAKEAD